MIPDLIYFVNLKFPSMSNNTIVRPIEVSSIRSTPKVTKKKKSIKKKLEKLIDRFLHPKYLG